MLPKLEDVKVSFGIFFQCFTRCLFFWFVVSLPSKFSKSIRCFLLDPNGSFLETFGSELWECLKTPLICHHVVLPISNGGVGLISSKVITPTTYMGSWALIAPIITSKFLLDFCSFLLKMKGVSNLGPPTF